VNPPYLKSAETLHRRAEGSDGGGWERVDVDRYERLVETRNVLGRNDGERNGTEGREPDDEGKSNSARKQNPLVIQSNFEKRAAMNEIEELTPSMYAALEAIEAQGGPRLREQISWEKMGSGKWRCWVKTGVVEIGDAGARKAGAGGGKKTAETSDVVLDQAVEGSGKMGLEKVWDLKRRVELPVGVAEAEERIRKRLMEESGMESTKRGIECVDIDDDGGVVELREVSSSGHASKRVRI
jgi:hypothetical protein